MSYQPEERYWTDYLRIALPVVGLLLMLGLFWYWASAVIGDDNDQPPATQPANVAVIQADTPTPTTKPEVVLNPETVTAEPTPRPTQESGNPPANNSARQPTEEPTATAEEEAPGKGFRKGDTVVTIDQVNMRVEPDPEADLIETLDTGTELEVLDPAVEAGGYFWLHVRDTASDQEGYVADEFVDEA